MRGPWGRGACPIAGTSGSFCGQCLPSQTGEKKEGFGIFTAPRSLFHRVRFFGAALGAVQLFCGTCQNM